MNRRTVAAVLGGGAVALGVLFVVAPGLAGSLTTTRSMVVVVGLVAAFLAFRAAIARRDAEFDRADLPEVESERAYTLPGDEFTERLRTAAATRRGQVREHVRDQLRRTTVSVLTTYRDLDGDEARAVIDEGTWTDDPYAAAFFTRVTPRRRLTARIRDVFQGRTAFDRRATRVVAELDRITEER